MSTAGLWIAAGAIGAIAIGQRFATPRKKLAQKSGANGQPASDDNADTYSDSGFSFDTDFSGDCSFGDSGGGDSSCSGD